MVSRNYSNGVSVDVTPFNYSFWWSLQFGAAGEVPLRAGSYRNATRFAFAAFNGLDVSGSGRGCNRLTGRFDVLEVEYAADGSVLRFAADFEQHCEGGSAALFGAIRYNSSISNLVPFGGQYPAYQLRIVPGANGVVTGNGVNCGNAETTCAVTFATATYQMLKATPDPGYQLLEWTGDCYGGSVIRVLVNTAIACTAVFVPDVSAARRTSLFLDSQSGDYIGQGLEHRYATNASFRIGSISTGGNYVTFRVEGKDDSYQDLDFRAPNGGRLVVGEYPAATRSAFSAPGAGIDISGNGRGCNTITGRFVVLEAEYNANGTIAAFAVDFEQHCEGGGPALFGSLRYNSTVTSILPFGGIYPVFRASIGYAAHGTVSTGNYDCGRYSMHCTIAVGTPTVVTLTATPESGYRFVDWVGDCVGTGPTTLLSVDADDRICTARFARTTPDTVAPVFSRVSNLRVTTTNAGGTAVSWLPPLAVDAVDGVVAVACDPPGGPVLPLGTTTVTCRAKDMAGNEAVVTFTVTVAMKVLGVDVTGDASSDLVWRHPVGDVVVWQMVGGVREASVHLGTIDPSWQIAAVGDITGDGAADFVWQRDSGTVVLWEMQGTTRVAVHTLFSGDTPWRVVASADLDGNDSLDLIWQGPSGAVAVWLMQGRTQLGAVFLYSASTPWRVVAAGDINGDGFNDLIWQGPAGNVIAWIMNRLARTSLATIYEGRTDWGIKGVVNINGDANLDLVWQHPSGEVVASVMNGVTLSSIVTLYGPTEWKVSGPR